MESSRLNDCASSGSGAAAKTGTSMKLKSIRGQLQRYERGGMLRSTASGHHGKVVVLEQIETEAERQLKELSKKQLRTDVSLNQHLENRKEFSPSAPYKSITDQLSGTRSLEEFRSRQNNDERIQEFLQFGLTEDEVKVKLQAEEEEVKVKLQAQDVEPSSKRQKCNADFLSQLETINEKIEAKKKELQKPTTFAATKTLGRHEMDLEKAISRERDQSQAWGCLVSEGTAIGMKPDHKYPHPGHPMNTISDILSSVTKKEDDQEDQSGEFIGPTEKPEGYVSKPDEHESMMGPWVPVSPSERTIKRVIGCKKPAQEKSVKGTSYCVPKTVSNFTACVVARGQTESSQVRLLNTEVESIPEEVILKNRLHVEEIKALPKFQKYERGIPSKTLYIKNLSPHVTEADLASVFLHFQSPEGAPVVFRLLTGRMRGQAFVTFHSEDSATAALELVNGFILKDKPVIIQYGRQETEPL